MRRSTLFVAGRSGDWGAATVAPDSTIAYYWGAFSRTVLELDLATGEVLRMATLPASTAAAGDPLSSLAGLGRWFGSWIAPTGLAKLYLDPALVISPDDARLYLVGTNATRFDDPSAGSARVWVVDAATLEAVDHWQPTADFVSIAVSRDGAFVYAAGLPGVDADGQKAPHAASVTVFDATNGTVRALAGQLGGEWLSIRGVLAP